MMEYYTTIGNDEVVKFSYTWMDMQNTMLGTETYRVLGNESEELNLVLFEQNKKTKKQQEN